MKATLFILSICFPLLLAAQALPEERVFIISERMDYLPGDSIQLEGKVLSNDSTAMPYSRFVYVEMFNAKDSVVERQKLVVNEKGEFVTKMQVSPLLGKDIYYIRAFTKFMANFSERTFPIFPLRIGVREQTDESLSTVLHAGFFPEGGHLVNGQPQNVGICLTDGNRRPIEAEYVLTDTQGDTICRQKTTPSGWQIVSFTPQKGKNYQLQVVYQGERSAFLLPEAYDSPVVQTIANRGRLIYRILQPDASIKEGKLYAYHRSCGLQILPMENYTGALSLEGLEEGAITLLLANNQGRIISQTSRWHSPTGREDRTMEKRTYTPGESLHVERPATADSTASVFVRVLPETKLYVPHAEHSLSLEADLQSTVPFPSRYNLGEKADRQKDLQAWLYSAWFKKFDVPRTVRDGITYRHQPETAMQILGAVKYARAPLGEGTLVAYNRENGQTFNTTLDEKGRFRLDVGDFGQGASFFVQAYSKHGKADIYDYEMSNDTLPGVSNWNKVKGEILSNEVGSWNQTNFDFEGLNELPELVVKARVVKEEKDKFTPARFNGRLYLDDKALEERTYQSFEDIVGYFHNYMFLMRKPNQPVDNESGDGYDTYGPTQWALFPRRPSTFGSNEVKILIDGVRHSATEAMNMLVVSQVKSVEYLKPGPALAVTHGAIDGALVIKTKRYEEKKVESKGIHYLPPMGLSNINAERQVGGWKVPTVKGDYRVLIDVISAKKGTHSYEFPIKVE